MRVQFHNQTIGKIGGLVLWFEVLGVPRNNIPFHTGISNPKHLATNHQVTLADTSKVGTTMIRNILHKNYINQNCIRLKLNVFRVFFYI